MPGANFDWQLFGLLATLLVIPALGAGVRCARAREHVERKYGNPIEQLRADIEATTVIPAIRDMLKDIHMTAKLTQADATAIHRAIDRRLQNVDNLTQWQKVRDAYAEYFRAEKMKSSILRLVTAEAYALFFLAVSGLLVSYGTAFARSHAFVAALTKLGWAGLIVAFISTVLLFVPEVVIRNSLSKLVTPEG